MIMIFCIYFIMYKLFLSTIKVFILSGKDEGGDTFSFIAMVTEVTVGERRNTQNTKVHNHYLHSGVEENRYGMMRVGLSHPPTAIGEASNALNEFGRIGMACVPE